MEDVGLSEDRALVLRVRSGFNLGLEFRKFKYLNIVDNIFINKFLEAYVKGCNFELY